MEEKSFDEITVRFMRAVKTHMGNSVGVDVLNALQPILGKEWTGRVVFNMLADNFKNNRQIAVIGVNSNYQKIACIKALRDASGRATDGTGSIRMGLKEAKDFIEDVESGRPQKITHWSEDENIVEAFMREMRASGAHVEYV